MSIREWWVFNRTSRRHAKVMKNMKAAVRKEPGMSNWPAPQEDVDSLDFSHMPDVSRAEYEKVRALGVKYAVEVAHLHALDAAKDSCIDRLRNEWVAIHLLDTDPDQWIWVRARVVEPMTEAEQKVMSRG